MSKTTRWLVRRFLCVSVPLIVAAAGPAPGGAAGGAPPKAEPGDARAAANSPGAPDAKPTFQLVITDLDEFLADLREGEEAAPGSTNREIADLLFESFSWVTRARIAAHHDGDDQPLQDRLRGDLLGDLDSMCKRPDVNLAKWRFAGPLYPASLLSKCLCGPDLRLRNQVLLTKEYPELRLREHPQVGEYPSPRSEPSDDRRFKGVPRLPSDAPPPPSLGDSRRARARITRALNQIDRTIEEWGRGSFSGFVLIDNISANGGQGFFNLNYNQPTEFYMGQVRQNVQGAVATLVQKTLTGQLQAQLTANANSLAPATATNSAAAATNPPAPVLTNAPAASATNAGPGGYLSLLPQTDSSPQLSENDVLKVGATDKETERVLNFMSDPINLPNNRRAYLCVVQVSISPGWRTKKGYVGEVQLNFRYGPPCAEQRVKRLHELKAERANRGEGPLLNEDGQRITETMVEAALMPGDPLLRRLGLTKPSSEFPAVLSIFPFADAQALDLRSSLQKQLNLLLQISASMQTVAPKLQAQLLASYQRLARQDSASRNLLPLVVPSSRAGDVTYRFDPEFQALAQPGNPDTKPGQVLEPSSFPALIVLICDEEEIMNYDMIVATTETRWLPAKYRNWYKHWFYDPLRYPWSRPGSALKNKERFETAANLDRIKSILDAYPGSSLLDKEASRRWNNLRTFAVGRTIGAAFPAVTPVVTGVYPASFRRDFMPTNITVFCRYVGTNEGRFRLKKVTLGGVVMDPGPMTGKHLLEVPLAGDRRDRFPPGSYSLEVVNAEGSTILSNAVTVLPVPAPVITAVFPTNLQELATATNAPSAGSPETNKFFIEPGTLTIAGNNLFVGDDSLRVVIGGVAVADAASSPSAPAQGAREARATKKDGANAPSAKPPPPSVPILRHDNSLTLLLASNSLPELKPGKYNVAVVTSGGQTVLTNGLVITPKKVKPDPNSLVVTAVHPAHGNLYSTTTISIVGTNFWGMRGGANYQPDAGGAPAGALVGRVTVGGVNCSFEYLSPSNLVAWVPPRSATYSTNEIAMATNKLEVVVSGPHGVGTLSNAIAFDLLLPRDGDASLEKHTPGEQQSQKTLDAVVLAARARAGTSAVLDTERLLTAAMILSQALGTNGAADSVTRTTTRVGPKEGIYDEYEWLKGPGVSVNILNATNGLRVPHRAALPSTNSPPGPQP